MNKLLFFFLAMLTGLPAFASIGKMVGAQLTYQRITPNSYSVTFSYVRDCDSLQPAATLDLRLWAPGCHSGRMIVLNKAGTPRPVHLTCPNDPPYCPGANVPAALVSYNAVVTLSVAEATCTFWNLSVSLPANSRAAMANLAGPSSGYIQAFFRHDPVFHNSSPEFSPLNIPLAVAVVNHPGRISLNPAEADGDSLAFELVQVMAGLTMPATLQPGFSATAILGSNPPLTFNPVTGEFNFTPTSYVPNVPRSQGNNRYAALVQINEYRKVNGVITLVGYIQREQVIEIVPATTSANAPALVLTHFNGAPFSLPDTLNLMAGQTSVIELGAADADPGESISMHLAAVSGGLLLNWQIQNNQTAQPVASIFCTPSVTDVGKAFRIMVELTDNGCPVKIKTNYLIHGRVGMPTGVPSQYPEEQQLAVFPNPFRDELNFRINNGSGRFAELVIFSLLGQEIGRIPLPTGTQVAVKWPEAGIILPGQYLVRLVGPESLGQPVKFTKF